MPVKQEITSGPCQETSFTAITLNPESNFTRREKNHPLFHWSTLTSPELHHTNLDVIQESRIDDCWNIDGSRDLSGSWSGFTQFTLIKLRNLQTALCGPGGDWQNGKRHPGQIIYGQNSGRNWQEMPSWGRSTNGQLKNQSSIILKDYEESISFTLRTRNSKKTPAMLEKNWKHQWLPCYALQDLQEDARMARPAARLNDFKSKFACILQASESTRMRMEESLPKYHEDYVAGRGENSLQHYNLVHKFIPMPQAQWRYPQ